MKTLIILSFLIIISLTVQAQSKQTRYDVDLELDYFLLKNIKDLDGTEDLLGMITFNSAKTIGKENSNATYLWRSFDADPFKASTSMMTGKNPVNTRISVFDNLTLNELRNIELKIYGYLSDDEGPFPSILFKCVECTNDIRHLKFISFPTTQACINNLNTSFQEQPLKFGEDTNFELNFYENGNKNNGWVKAMFKVWVKPHL